MPAERPHDGFHLIFEGMADGDWGGLLERGVQDGGQFDQPIVAKTGRAASARHHNTTLTDKRDLLNVMRRDRSMTRSGCSRTRVFAI